MPNAIVEKVKQELTFEKVLMTVMKTPGVKIKRDVFLHKELIKYCPEEVIQEAIRSNPAKAGISKDIINKVSMAVVNYETTKVTGISIAASLPSSGLAVAAAGAAAADITSYFAYILRTVQELAYLYGFEQFNLSEDDIDSETMNFLLVFLGVMFGVQGAATTLNKVANTMAVHVAKKISQQALTKGTIYPIVKKVAASIGVRMTKQIFADTVASGIPVLGSIVSGGITFAMFKPGCLKLRKNLMSYNLCDPDYYRTIDAHPVKEKRLYNLSRFHKAQKKDYGTVLAEIKAGRKLPHWMWYIFPQLKGLGMSDMADYYGLDGVDEAKAYLQDDELRSRLVEISLALLKLDTNDAKAVMGSPDHLKLRSSMTLFAIADPEEEVFEKVLDKFYEGKMDPRTMKMLGG